MKAKLGSVVLGAVVHDFSSHCWFSSHPPLFNIRMKREFELISTTRPTKSYQTTLLIL